MLLFAISILTYLQSIEQTDASRSIAHTHEVLSCVENVILLMHETDVKRRQYGFAGDEIPYRRSKSALQNKIDELRKITKSNAKHQERLNSLQEKIDYRFGLSDKVAHLALKKNLTEAHAIVNSAEFTDISAKILSLVSEMRNEENEAWALHYKHYQDRNKSLLLVLGLLTFGVVLVLSLLVILSKSFINEIRKTQSELSVSEGVTRSIIEQAYDAFVGIDLQGTVVHWNPRAQATFGWTSQEAIGKKLVDLAVPKEEQDLFQKHLENFRITGVSNFINQRVEKEALHKDGNMIPVEISIFSAGKDKSIVIYAFLHDISKRQKTAQELARSNSDLQQFAYLASHDLQEPLRTVITFSDMLSEKASPKLSLEEKEYLKFITEAVTRMRQLVKDLLSYSRIDSQGEELVCVDLNEVVKLALDNLHSAITESGAKINLEKLPTVYGDKTQLIQLFQNLFENALKFKNSKKPEIAVKFISESNLTKISVTDNGIGISMEYAEKIFELFQRLHPQSKYSGTGIGLSICKRIVERHGGKIEVVSSPEKGSTFSFTLQTPTG